MHSESNKRLHDFFSPEDNINKGDMNLMSSRPGPQRRRKWGQSGAVSQSPILQKNPVTSTHYSIVQ